MQEGFNVYQTKAISIFAVMTKRQLTGCPLVDEGCQNMLNRTLLRLVMAATEVPIKQRVQQSIDIHAENIGL